MTDTWVKIDELLKPITIPDILKWLKSHSIDLDGPQDIAISTGVNRQRMKTKKRFNTVKHEVRKTCFVKLKSANDANKFVKKFNEKKVNIGECKDLKLGVSTTKMPSSLSANKKRQKGFKWLKVTNLNPQVDAEELKKHIQKLSKVSPENVHVRHCSDATSSMAFVQMKSPNDAQTAAKKTQMSTLKGNQIWAEQVEGESRHLDLKKSSKGNVVIRNLPSSFNAKKAKKVIEEMCKQYGKVQKAITLFDREEYFGPSVRVQMSSVDIAQKVLDGLHGKELENGGKWTLSTAWWCSKGVGGRGHSTGLKGAMKRGKKTKEAGGTKKKTKGRKTGGKKKAATEDEMKELMKLKNVKISGKSKSGKGKDKLLKKGKKGKGNKQQKKRGVKKTVKV